MMMVMVKTRNESFSSKIAQDLSKFISPITCIPQNSFANESQHLLIINLSCIAKTGANSSCGKCNKETKRKKEENRQERDRQFKQDEVEEERERRCNAKTNNENTTKKDI